MKSTLRDERLFMEEELSEQLRQYEVLVFSRERELTRLSVKLREGRDAARSLIRHLQALLTPDELDMSQGWDLREQLAEGCRRAQHLIQKLSPGKVAIGPDDPKPQAYERLQTSILSQ
ncbi:neuroblastoma breakpoint family member 3-like [Nomascus leucogenys]|uniref:neuroblastoma breakpoint family member 3-like n=1 Tax=Nomascus leucogenys TaxID=61853 RepID=UPI00122D9C93|nr:neuroblastoma breakpoint family member 3-like [Nomascus leucogenys]